MTLRHPDGLNEAGPAETGPHEGPHRRCLVTGQVLPKEELLRFVLGPNQEVVPDLAERLPGRGLWLQPEQTVVEKAVARRLFARAARGPADADPALPAQVGTLLRRRCLERLGLLRRGGLVVAGYDQVHEMLSRGVAALLFEARDASVAPSERLVRLGCARRPDLQVVRTFASDELGAALGRGALAHVAVQAGEAADRLGRDVARLERYMGGGSAACRKVSAITA